MILKAYQLTREGVKELQTELDRLVAQRPEMAERIKTAREFGDLSENAEYQSARDEQRKSEDRISEIEDILANAEIIQKPRKNGVVELGSSLKLKSSNGSRQLQVVGTVEANPMEGKISNESPIGKALLGKSIGDSVEIVTSGEVLTYKIAEIN